MLKSLCALTLFSAAAFAQSVQIGLPQQGASFTPGQNITVQIQQPDSLTSVLNVAVVIGFQSCSNGPCVSPADDLPNVLYYGAFNPQFHEAGPGPYQNFSVQVPSSAPIGAAIIGVEYFGLVGDGNYLLSQIINQTITVA